MRTQSLLNKMFDLHGRAAKRRLDEHTDFLTFFEMVVRSAPADVTKAFGNMSVSVVTEKGEAKNCGIMLTAPDFLYWVAAIESGDRFASPPAMVKQSVLDQLSKSIGSMQMTPQEKGEFIDLMKAA